MNTPLNEIENALLRDAVLNLKNEMAMCHEQASAKRHLFTAYIKISELRAAQMICEAGKFVPSAGKGGENEY